MYEEERVRKSIVNAQRIVVKVGTRVLSSSSGALEEANLQSIVRQIADLHNKGKEVLLVSSGAVAAGVAELNFKSRPKRIPELQMTAAVGQAVVMSKYREAFAPFGIHTGQILLSQDNIEARSRHLNVRNTLFALLGQGIIPIINENDTVSTAEMKFGDNDALASLVSLMVGADVLVLMTTADGLCTWKDGELGELITYVEKIDSSILEHAKGPMDGLSLGGMKSKIEATKKVVSSGGIVGIVNGLANDSLLRFIDGEQIGTVCGSGVLEQAKVKHARKQWLAFFGSSQGKLFLDDGAVDAIVNKGRSLLPVGVTAIEGVFPAGCLVDLCSKDGHVFARGLVDFDSEELGEIKMLPSSQIEQKLGYHLYDEVVHRSNLVLID